MLMSQTARLIMRNTEKKQLKYYDDGGRPGRGNCTWGIGTKAHNGPCSKAGLAKVVTDADVESVFSSRLRVVDRGIDQNVEAELTQKQYDALVSLTYNVGVHGAQPVYDLLNAGNLERAATYIATMVTARQKRKGNMCR